MIKVLRTRLHTFVVTTVHVLILATLLCSSNVGLVYAVDDTTWQGVNDQQVEVWNRGIVNFDADIGCVPHESTTNSSANIQPFSSIQGIASGKVPVEGMKVGATTFGGKYIGTLENNVNGWTSTNTSQGSPVLTTIDDSGLNSSGSSLSGKVAWSELSNAALGSLPIGTKIAIHYGNRTIIAEKTNDGGTGSANGAPAAVSLWWEAARMLNFTSGSDTIDIKVVSSETPTTSWSDQAIPENDTAAAVADTTSSSVGTSYSQAAASPNNSSGSTGTSYSQAAQTAASTTEDAFTSSNANTRLQAIFSYLVSKGLTTTQAAAAVGNIAQESGGDATLIQGGKHTNDPSTLTTGGHGWGLIQWDPGAKVLNIAKSANITNPIYLSPTQLDIILWHMKNESPTGAKNMLAGFTQTDIAEATAYFEQKIEAAGIPKMENRIAAAKIALTYTATGISTAVNCGTSGTGVASQSLVSLIQQYAWPDNTHGTTPTEAYKTAIANARSAGKYIGGVSYPGIDCGGFITRLIQDSGYDATYGGGGNTTSQLNYVASHPDKYQAFVPTSTADLRFGDIAIKGGAGAAGHTFMYIGSGTVPGFSGNLVEASLDSHAPRNTNNLAYYLKTGGYSWFHLVGPVTSGTGAL